jgi:hypothetical protein
MLTSRQPQHSWESTIRGVGADFLDCRPTDEGKRSLLKRLQCLRVVVTIQSMKSTAVLPPSAAIGEGALFRLTLKELLLSLRFVSAFPVFALP